MGVGVAVDSEELGMRRRTVRGRVATMALCGLAAVVSARPVQGQVADVPRDHWAYQAVRDLASRGLVRGYPPDNDFFGSRTVTRYEMATILQRVLARVDEVHGRPLPAAPPALGPAQLEKVRRLVSEFRVELTVIGSDLEKATRQVEDLRGLMAGAQRAADRAAAEAAEARRSAEAARAETTQLKDAAKAARADVDSLKR